MKTTVSKRIWALVLVAVMVFGMLPQFTLHVHAAEKSDSFTVLNNELGVSYTVSTNYSNTADAGGTEASGDDEIVVTATTVTKTMTKYAVTNTTVITNNRAMAATLSFDYTVTLEKDKHYATINGEKITTNGATGSKEYELEPGESITIVSYAANQTGGKSSVVTLSNLKLVSNVMINATFAPSEHGTYKVDGSEISSETLFKKNIDDTYTIEVTPDANYTFVGFQNVETGAYVAMADVEAGTVRFTTAGTYKAVFAAPGSTYAVGAVKLDDFDQAMLLSASMGEPAVLLKNVTLTGAHTIPAGATFLIPYDAAGTLSGTSPVYKFNGEQTQYAYRTLTMASGASLTVNGTLEVGGWYNTSSGQYACNPTGAYGLIKMEANSSIEVNEYAQLFAWGYIIGSGKVTAYAGAKVYELFQLTDYRGGSKTAQVVNGQNWPFTNRGVFPFSQYYIQNIEVELKLYNGASEYVRVTITDASGSVMGDVLICFVGEGGMFNSMEQEDGSASYFTKRYIPTTDRMVYEANGFAYLDSITLSISGSNISSSSYTLPINSNVDIVVSGGEVYVSNDVALLPGATLTVAQDATAVIEGDLIVYDDAEWDKSYVYTGGASFVPVKYSPSGKGSRTLTDAKIDINGTLWVSGTVYTTESGANITSSESTGAFYMESAPGTDTKTYQYDQANSGVTAEWVEIKITAAQLKNADGTFVQTADSAEDTTFYYRYGKWSTCAHENAETTGKKDATCGEDGNTGDTFCPDCNTTLVTGTTIPATGNHQWKDATCTSPSICEICKAQKPGSSATGHEYKVTYTWNGTTCTAKGVCEHCGDTVTATATGGNKQVKTPGTCKTAEVYTLTATFTETWAKSNEKEFTGSTNPNNHETKVPVYEDLGNGKHKVTYPCCNHSYEEAHSFTNGSCACGVQSKVTITFVVDGTSYPVDVEYGKTPVYNDGKTPVKQSDATNHYTFTDWDKTIVAAKEAATYTAQFKAEAHTDTNPHDHKCDICEKELGSHSFTVQNPDSKYLAAEATCTSPAKYYYSCACGEKGTTTFEYGNKLSHTYGETTYEWSYEVYLNSCGDNRTFVVKELRDSLNIELRETNDLVSSAPCTIKVYTSEADAKTLLENLVGRGADAEIRCSVCTATRKCDCGDTQTATATIKSVTVAGTCKTDGSVTYTATFTQDWAKTQTKKVNTGKDASNHEEGLGTEWFYDGTQHWHEYSCCGAKVDESAHSYTVEKADSQYIKENATCTHGTIYYKSCVCGAKGTETFEANDKLNHTYDQEVVNDRYLVLKATCTSPAIYAKSCTCGACEGTTATFKYGEPDLTNHSNCEIGSDWKTDGTYHWKEYTKCGQVVAGTKAAHVDTDPYDHKCDICGHTLGEHSYGETTYKWGYGVYLTGVEAGKEDAVVWSMGNMGVDKEAAKSLVKSLPCFVTVCDSKDLAGGYLFDLTYMGASGEVRYTCAATRECDCGHSETAHASLTSTTTAGTCITKEKTVYTGTFTEAWANKTQTNTVYGEYDKSNHEKDLGTEWCCDGTQHWHKYTCCGAEGEKSDHTWSKDFYNGAYFITCSECGAKYNGWFTNNEGKKYYCINGEALKGVTEIEGKMYYLSMQDGEWLDYVNGPDMVYGEIYYFEGGIAQKGVGLVRVDGAYCTQLDAQDHVHYYYFPEDSYKAVRNEDNYHIDILNGLALPEANYNFNEYGIIEHDVNTELNGMAFATGTETKYYFIDGVKVGLGLIEHEGNYYYIRTSTGEVVRDRVYYISANNGLIDAGTYYFDTEGKLVNNGWVNANSYTYYYVNGVKVTGPVEIEGKIYFFNYKNGRMFKSQKAWVNENKDLNLAGGYYQVDENGVLQTVKNGWETVGDYTYYYVNGVRATGPVKIDGSIYFFNYVNGRLFKSQKAWVTENTELGITTGMYEVDANGVLQLAKNGWETVYVEWTDSDGETHKGDQTYYYVNGERVKGLVEIDGAYYLFNSSSGALFTDGNYWVGTNDCGLKAGFYDVEADGKLILK